MLLVALVSGCGGGSDRARPLLDAWSDSDGVLHVEGTAWNGCGRVTVQLPDPWSSSEQRVGADGRFSLTYSHPEVKPYEGTVTATCTSPSQVVASARIAR